MEYKHLTLNDEINFWRRNSLKSNRKHSKRNFDFPANLIQWKNFFNKRGRKIWKKKLFSHPLTRLFSSFTWFFCSRLFSLCMRWTAKKKRWKFFIKYFLFFQFFYFFIFKPTVGYNPQHTLLVAVSPLPPQPLTWFLFSYVLFLPATWWCMPAVLGKSDAKRRPQNFCACYEELIEIEGVESTWLDLNSHLL